MSLIIFKHRTDHSVFPIRGELSEWETCWEEEDDFHYPSVKKTRKIFNTLNNWLLFHKLLIKRIGMRSNPILNVQHYIIQWITLIFMNLYSSILAIGTSPVWILLCLWILLHTPTDNLKPLLYILTSVALSSSLIALASLNWQSGIIILDSSKIALFFASYCTRNSYRHFNIMLFSLCGNLIVINLRTFNNFFFVPSLFLQNPEQVKVQRNAFTVWLH